MPRASNSFFTAAALIFSTFSLGVPVMLPDLMVQNLPMALMLSALLAPSTYTPRFSASSLAMAALSVRGMVRSIHSALPPDCAVSSTLSSSLSTLIMSNRSAVTILLWWHGVRSFSVQNPQTSRSPRSASAVATRHSPQVVRLIPHAHATVFCPGEIWQLVPPHHLNTVWS